MISLNSPLKKNVSINHHGIKFDQEILYDYKPKVCKKCFSFTHDYSVCPLNPQNIAIPKGMSHSKHPHNRL